MTHTVTPETIAEVEAMAAHGITQTHIAEYMGIAPKTLRKHYSRQIVKAKVGRVMRVASMAYDMAISGKYPVMTMFYLKTQGHWKDNGEVEIEEIVDTSVSKIEIVRVGSKTDGKDT